MFKKIIILTLLLELFFQVGSLASQWLLLCFVILLGKHSWPRDGEHPCYF